MKIVFVVTTIDRGGAESLLYDICRKIHDNNEVSILFIKGSATLLPLFNDIKIPVSGVIYKNAWYSIKNVLKLFRMFYTNSDILIQGWMYHGNLLATFLWFFNRRNKLYWSIHHSAFDLKNKGLISRLKLKINALFSRFPQKVAYVTELIANEHLNYGFSEKNKIVIHNGIDTEKFLFSQDNRHIIREYFKIPENAFVIGAIGRNHPVKDYSTFFRCASILLRQNELLYFIVIGRDLSLDRFSDELENVSLDKLKRIIIIDETNEVNKYYSAFDLFTMTSISEALSLVLLEALGSERLCLVTEGIFHDSSFRDLVYTFAPKEVDNYVSEVKRIMSLGKEERKKLGEIARQKINDEYSLTKMLNEFMKIWLNN